MSDFSELFVPDYQLYRVHALQIFQDTPNHSVRHYYDSRKLWKVEMIWYSEIIVPKFMILNSFWCIYLSPYDLLPRILEESRSPRILALWLHLATLPYDICTPIFNPGHNIFLQCLGPGIGLKYPSGPPTSSFEVTEIPISEQCFMVAENRCSLKILKHFFVTWAAKIQCKYYIYSRNSIMLFSLFSDTTRFNLHKA